MNQVYTVKDLKAAEDVVMGLSGVVGGFDAWSSHIAKAFAKQREAPKEIDWGKVSLALATAAQNQFGKALNCYPAHQNNYLIEGDLLLELSKAILEGIKTDATPS